MRERMAIVVSAAMLTGLACVTINVYFPEAEIKDLSRVIEDEVRKQAALREGDTGATGEEPAPETRPAAPGTSSSSTRIFDLLLGVTPAYAQGVGEPEVTNPAIRVIIASRAGRLERLNAFKRQGFIGENNKGMIETRDLGNLADLKARAELTKLVRDENGDRERLFKEIAIAKGVDAGQVSRIAETYAETLRAEARAGDWIQMPDGSWKQK